MASLQERALIEAKQKFEQSVNEFGPLQFMKEHPFSVTGIAAVVGFIVGLADVSALNAIVLSYPVKGLIKRCLKR